MSPLASTVRQVPLSRRAGAQECGSAGSQSLRPNGVRVALAPPWAAGARVGAGVSVGLGVPTSAVGSV